VTRNRVEAPEEKNVYGLVFSVVEGKLYTTHPIYSYFLHVTFLFGFPVKILYACYSELYNAKIKCKYLETVIISKKN
jgi:hypothetical protein